MRIIRPLLLALLLSLIAASPGFAAGYTSIGSPGTISRSNGSVTPGLPSGWAAGNLCVLLVMSQLTATDVITDPSGWTVLVNRGTHSKLYGRIMVGGDTDPTISFSQTNGHIGQIQCYSGNVYTDLSTIVITSGTNFSAAASVPTVPNLTISTDNALVIVAGSHLKTAVSNGTTYDDIANFTEIAEDRPSGTLMDFVWNYWIQTTATSLSGITRTMTGTTESTQVVSLDVALKSAPVPTFTSAPAIGTRTTSSIPVNFTSDTTGTVYGARLTDGSSTPTCDALEAQTATGGVQYWSEAVTATVADAHTFSSITDGTVTDGYFCIEDGSGNDSAVASIANMYKLPAFTSGPTFSSCSATGCTYSLTLDGAGTVYGVACKEGSTAVTVTQVEAANCTGNVAAVAAANKAVTGADTLTIGTALDFPTHDFGLVATYGSQHEAAIHADTNRFKTAPTGTAYQALASVGSGSFCEGITSPSVAASDVLEVDSATTSGAYAVTLFDTCHLNYSGDDSRQRLCYRIYDDSAQGFMAGTGSALCTGTRFALWFNNESPVFAPNSGTLIVDIGSAMTAVDFCAQATDAEGDTLTAAITAGTLPTGLSLSGTGNCSLGGTPTVENESGVNVTVTVTDIAGATDDYQLTIYPLDTLTVPNCVNTTLGACIDALQAIFLDAGVISFGYSVTIPAGNVISQSPAAATEQEAGTAVDLVVSRGVLSKNRRGVGINLGIGIP